MSAPFSTPPSKGMMMIAAYRAERLNQRPALRTGLLQNHLARRGARNVIPVLAKPDEPLQMEALPGTVPIQDVREAQGVASVFASLVNTAEAEQAACLEVAHAEQPSGNDVGIFDAEPDLLVVQVSELEAEPTPNLCPIYDPPLAEIGFGPGMLIRLSQLGLHTTADLAQADPTQLRTELGDISRLVDVEAWIASARKSTCATSAS